MLQGSAVDRRTFYRGNGYYLARNIVPADALATLNNDIRRLFARQCARYDIAMDDGADEAARLRGQWVHVAREDAPALPEGVHYVDELVGGEPLEDIGVLTRPKESLVVIMKDGKIYKNALAVP